MAPLPLEAVQVVTTSRWAAATMNLPERAYGKGPSEGGAPKRIVDDGQDDNPVLSRGSYRGVGGGECGYCRPLLSRRRRWLPPPSLQLMTTTTDVLVFLRIFICARVLFNIDRYFSLP